MMARIMPVALNEFKADEMLYHYPVSGPQSLPNKKLEQCTEDLSRYKNMNFNFNINRSPTKVRSLQGFKF